MFRVIIAGAGGMGRAWGNNLRNNSETEVVGWVDIRPGIAGEAAEECKVNPVYLGEDLGKAIADTKPDFVVDVTIPEAHHDVTLQALGAGVPVLGEKPMAASMEQAREMVAASEKSGKLYMVSQSRRYDSRIDAYKTIIDENIGRMGILNSDFYIGAHFGGFRDEMPSPLILDMAIHTFDSARYLCGLDPIAVYCEEYNPSWSWYKVDASATAIFEMEDGLRYTYCGSWCSEGRNTSWECEWRAVGAKGSATWDGVSDIRADVTAVTGEFMSRMEGRTIKPVDGIPGGIEGSLLDLLKALKTGSTPMVE
jgi:predicted dehydrogenase